MTLTEWDRMSAGELYRPGDPDLVSRRVRTQKLMQAYNGTTLGDPGRGDLLSRLLGSQGADCVIRAPFYVDYGTNIHLGRDVFFNYSCVVLDVCPVTIGDGTQIGPAVQILTADHPRDPKSRASGLEFGRPITIGRNVWIGGAALILPGVSIGHDAIIGAGAVVTKNVPNGATAMGNPARHQTPKANY